MCFSAGSTMAGAIAAREAQLRAQRAETEARRAADQMAAHRLKIVRLHDRPRAEYLVTKRPDPGRKAALHAALWIFGIIAVAGGLLIYTLR